MGTRRSLASIGVYLSSAQEHPMTTRRGFLTTAGAVAAHEHAHAQGDDHDHEHQAAPSDLTLRVKALESLLVEKGLVDPAALDALIDNFGHTVGPRKGAR